MFGKFGRVATDTRQRAKTFSIYTVKYEADINIKFSSHMSVSYIVMYLTLTTRKLLHRARAWETQRLLSG